MGEREQCRISTSCTLAMCPCPTLYASERDRRKRRLEVRMERMKEGMAEETRLQVQVATVEEACGGRKKENEEKEVCQFWNSKHPCHWACVYVYESNTTGSALAV